MKKKKKDLTETIQEQTCFRCEFEGLKFTADLLHCFLSSDDAGHHCRNAWQNKLAAFTVLRSREKERSEKEKRFVFLLKS